MPISTQTKTWMLKRPKYKGKRSVKEPAVLKLSSKSMMDLTNYPSQMKEVTKSDATNVIGVVWQCTCQPSANHQCKEEAYVYRQPQKEVSKWMEMECVYGHLCNTFMVKQSMKSASVFVRSCAGTKAIKLGMVKATSNGSLMS